MNIYYSPNHKQHNPPFEVFNGEKTSAQEIPDRAENIKKTLESLNFRINEVTTLVPESLLLKLHSKKYLNYLKFASEKLKTNEYSYPSVFNLINDKHDLSNKNKAVHGSYCYDMYTPILKGTHLAALSSASCAYHAALDVKISRKSSYSLSRPPGHHAYRNLMGGYCYLNNSAVAAEVLLNLGNVAILDIDVHHGNGTQGIFYERSDVLTVSIHADPDFKFPHISGFEEEIGSGEGWGFNRNFVLPIGTTNETYLPVLENALKTISDFNAQALVIALGVDTHESDPIGGFNLTTDFYSLMSSKIKQLSIPTVIVQEGGYNNQKLGENVATFLEIFNK